MKEEKVKTQKCYLRMRRGVLCVDVVAECDKYYFKYVGEWWERGVCTGKEGGPGGVRGVEGGGVVSPPPSTHPCAATCGTGSDLTRPSDEFGSRGARTLHHSKRLHIRGGAPPKSSVLSGSAYHFALDDDGDGSREVLHGDSVGDSAGEDSRFPVTVEVRPARCIPKVLLLAARLSAPVRIIAGTALCLSCRRPYRM
jgi:hypothetical protein